MVTFKELKVKTLQDIASSCGLAKSGRKVEIYHRIRTAARDFKPLPSKVRIMSIDMGIRNMAFCILRPGKLKTAGQGGDGEGGRKPSVQVSAWQRLSLNVGDSVNASENATSTEITSTSTIEDFSPSHMAKIALSFVQTHILPAEPTHILIERQRFRSANSPSINNWTIRVNSLEAMLYSALAVYQSLGKFKGQVVPVVPRNVALFLLNENQFTYNLVREGMKAAEAEGSIETSKKNKVDLLTKLIKHDDGLISFEGDQAGQIAAGFKARGGPRSSSLSGKNKQVSAVEKGDKKVESQSFTKVDDLADCLLQGITWIEWQRNMEHLIKTEGWVTGLEEEDLKLLSVGDDEGVVRKKRPRRRKVGTPKEEPETMNEVKTKRARRKRVVNDATVAPKKEKED